ncbi:MAG TPA: 50S ribosomal protein L6 [bacterium]
MSRLGKRPIALPKGVTAQMQDGQVKVKGPKGESLYPLPSLVQAELAADKIQLKADYQNNKDASRLMGTAAARLRNMVDGVATGFTKKLQLVGVGYRAAVQGTTMELALGYSKPIKYPIPTGVKAVVDNNTLITLTSHDNVLLGQAAATIRGLRPPEPYQGKGVMYENEKIRRKAGKTGKK